MWETRLVARFRYDPNIIKRFPAVVGGVIHATGVHNDPAPPRLAAAFHDETLAARTRIGETPLSELPTLAAWRKVFRGFGVDPTQYRTAAEALLRRLTKQGEPPSIGTLVDLANLVSIRYALPVAVFDERWADLGSSQTEHPEPGEVIFADEADEIGSGELPFERQSEDLVASLEGEDPSGEALASARRVRRKRPPPRSQDDNRRHGAAITFGDPEHGEPRSAGSWRGSPGWSGRACPTAPAETARQPAMWKTKSSSVPSEFRAWSVSSPRAFQNRPVPPVIESSESRRSS